MKGFFLSRFELDAKSTCSAIPSPIIYSNDSLLNNNNSNHGFCWRRTRPKRFVLFVIDALRFDFALYDESATEGADLAIYKNKLPIIHELLQSKPDNTAFFKFVSDPPTTTSQRLKGLTTGGLPTFIDAGKNFNSDEISEDNLIYQLASHGKKIVSLGDDTWKGLFPLERGLFARARLFPSFNIKDLHSVDDGILRYLDAELRSVDNLEQVYKQHEHEDIGVINTFEKWDVLIAHFLGVDHAGHKSGVHHKEMSEKLIQMNEILKSVTASLPEDTVLLVFGDHGQTDSGDHGGGSDIEVDSALFVYSPYHKLYANDFEEMLANKDHTKFDCFPTTPKGERKCYRAVPQIDIVPTLSLLMDVPIPYGNLGTIIPELFVGELDSPSAGLSSSSSDPKQRLQQGLWQAIEAIHINSWQVRNYLHAYSEKTNTFDALRFAEIDELFDSANKEFKLLLNERKAANNNNNNTEQLLRVLEKYREYLKKSSEMCREMWTTFDLQAMALGVVVLACAFVTLCYHIYMLSPKRRTPSSQPRVRTTTMFGLTKIAFCICIFSVVAGLFLALVAHQSYHMFAEGAIKMDVVVATVAVLSTLLYWIGTVIIDRRAKIAVAASTTASTTCTTTASISPKAAASPDDATKPSKRASGHCTPSRWWSWWSWWSCISFGDVFGALATILYMQGLFSNSFIVKEDRVILFLIISSVIFVYGRAILSEWASSSSSSANRSSTFAKRLALVVVLLVCTKLSTTLVRYRSHGTHLIVEPEKVLYEPPVLLALLVLPALILDTRTFMALRRRQGTYAAGGIMLWALVSLVYHPLVITCVFKYWQQQQQHTDFSNVLLPRIVYAAAAIAVAVITLFEVVLPKRWKQDPLSTFRLVVDFVFASRSLLLAVLYVPLMLLGDQQYAFIYLLLIVQVLAFAELNASLQPHQSSSPLSATNTGSLAPQPPRWFVMLQWFFFAQQYFFATGHQNTFNTVQWNSCFVGLEDASSNIILPGVLVVLNTWGPKMLFAVIVPWILTAAAAAAAAAHETQQATTTVNNGAAVVVVSQPQQQAQQPQQQQQRRHQHTPLQRVLGRRHFLFLLAKYAHVFAVFYSLSALLTTVFVALQRRHLMVWAIFAPKFIFDTASMLLLDLALLGTFASTALPLLA